METLKVQTIVETEQADASIENLNKEIKSTDEATKGLTDQLDKMTGGAVTGFRKMVTGIKSGVVAMKTLKGAIAATGIGLLVIAVGTLVSYFKNTQSGADKLIQVFETVGATIDVLIDRISSFGSGLFEILKGNFSAGLDILKDSMTGIGDEIIRESSAALQLEKDFQKLEKRKIDFIVTEKKLRAEIEAARLAAEDSTKGVKAQADAIEKAINLEKQLANERAEQTREELRIVAERNSLGETMNEDLEKQRILEAQLFEIESQRDTKLKELVARQRSLTQAKQQEKDVTTGENTDSLDPIQSAYASILTPEQEAEIKQEEFLREQLNKVNSYWNDVEKKNVQAAADEELRIEALKQQAKEGIISKGFAIVGELTSKNEKAAKYTAAAQATFDTYAAIAGQLKAFSGVPVPGLAIAQAVATGAFGFLQVQKILSTPTGSSSVPSVSSGGGAGVSIPRDGETDNRAPNFESLNFGVGGQQNASFGAMRAVVINSQFNDQQKVNSRVNDLLSNG